MARMLAHIEVIQELRPVYLVDSGLPADNIELARVLGWLVVVKKGEFKVGDFAVYIEVDSKVPADNPHFAFLANKDYKIKAMKLNKFYSGTNPEHRVISQGILFSTSVLLPPVVDMAKSTTTPVAHIAAGIDVTSKLGITKIEDETAEVTVSADTVISRLAQKHWFLKTKLGRYLLQFHWFKQLVKSRLLPHFKTKKYPTYIIKTDETRIQAIPQVFEKYRGVQLQVTEKLDGTSTTFGIEKIGKNKFDFAVCSRNVRQLDHNQKTWYINEDVNFYWEMAIKYDIKNILMQVFKGLGASSHVYLQGETIGPAIQGNKYKLASRDFYAFNLVVDGKKLDSVYSAALLAHYGIKWVPLLDDNFYLPETIEDLLDYATAQSVLYPTLREGVVIRDADNTVSFKAVSPQFLIKHNL